MQINIAMSLPYIPIYFLRLQLNQISTQKVLLAWIRAYVELTQYYTNNSHPPCLDVYKFLLILVHTDLAHSNIQVHVGTHIAYTVAILFQK